MQKHYCEGPRLGSTAYVQCSTCRSLVSRPDGLQGAALRPRSYTEEEFLLGTSTYDQCRKLMVQSNTRSEVFGLGQSDEMTHLDDAKRQPRRAKGVVLVGRFVGLQNYDRRVYVTQELRRSVPRRTKALGSWTVPDSIRTFHRSMQPKPKAQRTPVERPRSARQEARAKELSQMREVVANAPRLASGAVVLGSDLARKLGIVAIGNIE